MSKQTWIGIAAAGLLVASAAVFGFSYANVASAQGEAESANRSYELARAALRESETSLAQAKEKLARAERRADARRIANSFFDGVLGTSSEEKYLEELGAANDAYEPVLRKHEATEAEARQAANKATVARSQADDAEAGHTAAVIVGASLATAGVSLGAVSLALARRRKRVIPDALG